MPLTRTLNEHTFTRECTLAGFLGAYQFWHQVCQSEQAVKCPPLLKHGNQVLKAIAILALAERDGYAGSPQEEEAFIGCGLSVKGVRRPSFE